jgi:hypothetical protein
MRPSGSSRIFALEGKERKGAKTRQPKTTPSSMNAQNLQLSFVVFSTLPKQVSNLPAIGLSSSPLKEREK